MLQNCSEASSDLILVIICWHKYKHTVCLCLLNVIHNLWFSSVAMEKLIYYSDNNYTYHLNVSNKEMDRLLSACWTNILFG